MGNVCCNGKAKSIKEKIVKEQTNKNRNWETLLICEEAVNSICPTSKAVDRVTDILVNLIFQLNRVNIKKEKDKVTALFSKEVSSGIKYCYSDTLQEKDLNFYKLLEMYKQQYKASRVSPEVELRIFHTLASNIQKIGCFTKDNRKLFIYNETSYTSQLIDELVQLECIESIVQKSGEKLNYQLTQLKMESKRMNKMLKEIGKNYLQKLKALKFDLENQSDYLMAAKISECACKYHEDGIFYLIAYFRRCFEKLESQNKDLKQMQAATQHALNTLGELYKHEQKIKNLDEYREPFKKFKSIQEKKFHFQEGDKLSQLNEIIFKEANNAQSLKEKLEWLVSQCCIQDSLWVKTEMKIDPQDLTMKTMIEATEQILLQTIIQTKDQPIKPSLIKQAAIKREEQAYYKRIQAILQEKQAISFTIGSLLKGRCVFQTIQDLLSALQRIKAFVQNHKDIFGIVEVGNRTTKQSPITDFILTIQIDRKIVAELYLSLQSNFAIQSFTHNLNKLIQPNLFTNIKNLCNYFIEYRKKMVPMIISQLQNKDQFRDEEKQGILSYFQIDQEQKQTFSLKNSLLKKINDNKGELDEFLKRFKYAQPAINMILFRKLGKIDEDKVQLINKQQNNSVRGMMILQLMKFWNPFVGLKFRESIQKNQPMFQKGKSLSFRNLLLYKQYFQSQLQITEYVYGDHSIELARHLYQQASLYYNYQFFEKAYDYCEQAKKCIDQAEEQNLALKIQIKLKYIQLQIKISKFSSQTIKQLEGLRSMMKKNNNTFYVVAIQLLMSEYYLIYKNDEEDYLRHYNQGIEIMKREGIPWGDKLFCEIKWRIWKYQFNNAKDQERKKQIFENNLSEIIAEFGTYKVFEQISDRLKEFQTYIIKLDASIQFKPNKISTKLILKGLTQQNWKLLSKMSFQALILIDISKSVISEKQLCEYLSRSSGESVRQVHLNENGISGVGVKILSTANWPDLEHIQFLRNPIQDKQKMKQILIRAFPKAQVDL